jgi:uncharacterized membrane protein YesL
VHVLTRIARSLLTIVLAGILWLLASAPIVTVVPATAALYAVLAAWDESGPPPVWSTYRSGFRQHFRQAMWFTVLLAAASIVLFLDIRYGLHAEGAPIRPVVMVTGVVGTFLLSGMLVFLFPVMVSHPGPWRLVLRNTGLFAAAYVFSTLLGMLVFAAGVLVFVAVPVALPIVVSTVAFLVSRITGRVFDRFLISREAAAASAAGAPTGSGWPERSDNESS